MIYEDLLVKLNISRSIYSILIVNVSVNKSEMYHIMVLVILIFSLLRNTE